MCAFEIYPFVFCRRKGGFLLHAQEAKEQNKEKIQRKFGENSEKIQKIKEKITRK